MSLGATKSRFLLISLAILVADQWSKWQIEARIPHHGANSVISGFLNLIHVRNSGVAFGLFAANGAARSELWLTVLGFVALAAVGSYFWRTSLEDRTLLVALALVVGGALGNLIDRIATGAVTDFVDVYLGSHHWPAFNVADAAISIGIGLLILDSLRTRPPAEPTPEAAVEIVRDAAP